MLSRHLKVLTLATSCLHVDQAIVTFAPVRPSVAKQAQPKSYSDRAESFDTQSTYAGRRCVQHKLISTPEQYSQPTLYTDRLITCIPFQLVLRVASFAIRFPIYLAVAMHLLILLLLLQYEAAQIELTW